MQREIRSIVIKEEHAQRITEMLIIEAFIRHVESYGHIFNAILAKEMGEIKAHGFGKLSS